LLEKYHTNSTSVEEKEKEKKKKKRTKSQIEEEIRDHLHVSVILNCGLNESVHFQNVPFVSFSLVEIIYDATR